MTNMNNKELRGQLDEVISLLTGNDNYTEEMSTALNTLRDRLTKAIETVDKRKEAKNAENADLKKKILFFFEAQGADMEFRAREVVDDLAEDGIYTTIQKVNFLLGQLVKEEKLERITPEKRTDPYLYTIKVDEDEAEDFDEE